MAKQNEELRTLDDLPAMLKAEHIMAFMGLSKPTVYELLHRDDFPVIKIGKRRIVYKEAFAAWLDSRTGAQ